MIHFPRFFYSDGADGGGTAGADVSIDQPTVVESLITAEELKEFGVENKDQLRTLLNQHRESKVTVEEKQKQENLRKADFIKFSSENDLLKVDEVNAYENQKSKPDRDLAFEKHLEEWKEDNPEVTDPEEILSQAKEDFESEYRFNSENEKQKARGLEKLGKRANELRSTLSTKYTAAEQRYQEQKAMEGKVPEFNKTIGALIDKFTPEKLAISKVKEGEAEVPIEVELDKKEKAELAKAFLTPKMFHKFQTAKDLSEFESLATKKINGFLKEKYFDAAVSKGYEAGKGVGVTKGSNVGAEQPFAIVRTMNIPSAEGKKDAYKEVMEDDARIRQQTRR